VHCVSTTGETKPFTRSNTQKIILICFMHGIRQNYGRTPVGPGTTQAGPLFTQMQILDQPVMCPRAESPKFPSFFDFPPAKRVLSNRSSKSLQFYPIKNVFKKKRWGCIKKRKRVTLPASTADPKKIEKVDFDFCQSFFRFLCQAPRCGSKVPKTQCSEVTINKVMTQNRIALFKPRPLYACGCMRMLPAAAQLCGEAPARCMLMAADSTDSTDL
jgi:hypothetical protein